MTTFEWSQEWLSYTVLTVLDLVEELLSQDTNMKPLGEANIEY